MHKRSDKVGEAIHEMISGLLVKGIKDPRIGFVTITAVEMSPDLHLAKVYYSVMGDEESRKASQAGLNSAIGFIRKEVGRNLRMRYIPEIVFKFDSSIEQGDKIERLLNQINEEEPKND